MIESSRYEDGWFFHNHAWHLLHEIIKKIPDDTKTMLDIGAGSGLSAAVIRAVKPDIVPTLFDINDDCAEFWERRKLCGIVGSYDFFNDKRFDLVMSSHVLEHVQESEAIDFIKSAYRVTKKRLIIVVPDGDTHFKDHKVIYDRVKFKEAIKTALDGEMYCLDYFPVYHPHMNNLIAIIDRLK